MSHLNPGLISAYNSLTDKHLAGYFSNTRIRRHLQRAGLITRSGRIVPDKEYRHKLMQRAHQRHVRECLAQAIFHKVLEMERLHQIEIKRKLEEFARRERVHKIKVERSKRYEEEIIRILSPRPPTGARGVRKQHSGPEGEHTESSESPSSSRPNTAPGKMQRPVRLKPIHSNSTTASLRRSSPHRPHEPSHGNSQPFNCTMDRESRRRLNPIPMEASHGISPYCLPVINNFVTPVPPATRRRERGAKVTRSSTIRGRRLRPTTASSGADVIEEPPLLRSSVHQSKVSVNMMYFGKTVHLSHDLTDMRDDVKVFQQHCGGENLCVFKGRLCEGETFQFVSRRHRGFPFSLTFFLNGLQVERLSSCCEFKHRKGSRLGGRHGHFGFCGVEGASPCYKCIIAMGLDKKPTPPPKRVKENGGREESLSSAKDSPETERMGEDAASPSECETSQPQVEEETAHDEDKVRDEYEEDFEADDEGAADDGKSHEKKSVPLSNDSEKQIKGKDAAETEDDENDEDIKSRSGSSSSGSDREESDDEAAKDPEEDEKAGKPEEAEQQESVAAPNEGEEPNPEQAAATEVKPAAVNDSDLQDSAGDSTEIAVSDTSGPDSGDKDADKAAEGSKEEEGQERVKSVQEKLAEAILKESQCSSEPELSDTSTEESVDEGPKQGSKDAAPEKLYTIAESEQTFEESGRGQDVTAEEQQEEEEEEEEAAAQEQRDERVQELRENSERTKEREAVENEEDEKPAGGEEKEKSEGTDDHGEVLLSVNKDNVAQDEGTAGPLEEAPAESTEPALLENNQETGEQAAMETNSQEGETGQRAKSKEEDDSSVSEPNKKTDETLAAAAADNAEAEATAASETTEMKAASSEEQEALGCGEAPVTDAGMEQRAQSEDRTPASETGATAETSSSSAGESGDTAVEKAVGNGAKSTEGDANERNKEEENKGDRKQESDLMSETVTGKDESQNECKVEEEGTETSVEIDENVEEPKSEEDGKEKEKQSHLNEREEDKSTEEEEKNGKEEAQEANESNLDREKDKEAKIEAGNDSNGDAEDDKEAGKALSEQNPVTAGENNEKAERKEEESECVLNKDEKKESEAKENDENKEGDETSQTAAAAEVKGDEAEKSESDAKESEAEQAEVTDNKEDEEKTDKIAGEGGEITEITGDTDKERLEGSCEDVVESEKESEIAEGTKTTEGTSVHTTEAENVKSEADRRPSPSSETGAINAENGEPSVGAEGNTHENQEEVPPADGQESDQAAERGEEAGRTTEGPREEHGADTAEASVTSERSTEEKHKDHGAEQAAQGQTVEGDGKEDKDAAEISNESPQEVSVPETSGTEIKGDNEELPQTDPKSEDRQDSEGTEPGKISGNGENRESVLVEKNNNINEVIVVSSREQQQCSTTKSVDFDDTTRESDEVIKEPGGKSETKTDKPPRVDEGPVGLELSAAEENGADMEEVSKDSEEGASVLLKPQAQNCEEDEDDEAGRSDAVGKGPPEALTVADNRDLVTNWVNMHQSSKFFETFVEPLEELQEAESTKGETPAAELLVSDASPEVVKTPDGGEKAPELNEDDESPAEMKVVESDQGSGQAEDKANESEAGKDPQQDVETTEVKDLLKAESKQSDRESGTRQQEMSEAHRESRSPPGRDKTQDRPAQADSEDAPFSKAEVDSVPGTVLSVVSHKPESYFENQPEEKDNSNGSDLNLSQEVANDVDNMPPSPEGRPSAKSPEGHKDTVETQQGGDELHREVTEVTELTASKSDEGSREETGEQEAKVSEESVGRDQRELIHDIKHTLSKDRLSTFSVDETLFGRGSYSLLTAARTESGV